MYSPFSSCSRPPPCQTSPNPSGPSLISQHNDRSPSTVADLGTGEPDSHPGRHLLGGGTSTYQAAINYPIVNNPPPPLGPWWRPLLMPALIQPHKSFLLKGLICQHSLVLVEHGLTRDTWWKQIKNHKCLSARFVLVYTTVGFAVFPCCSVCEFCPSFLEWECSYLSISWYFLNSLIDSRGSVALLEKWSDQEIAD